MKAMSERKVKVVGDNFADIHKTADAVSDADESPGVGGADKDTKDMANDTVKFWTLANLRLTFLNGVIVAVIAVVVAYTSNLLTQQALAARIDALELKTTLTGSNRDEQMKNLGTRIDDNVTKEVLQLQLEPIKAELKDQRAILEQIRLQTVTPQYRP